MLVRLIVVFVFVLSCSNCFTSNSESPHSIWVRKLCCESDFDKFEIRNLIINSSNTLEVELCEIVNDTIRISLMDKSINKTALLFDLISVGNFGHKKIRINKDYKDYFKGEFNRFFVGNGDYRLSIANGNSCGEVLFIVSDGEIKNKKFNCINRCSL